MRIGLDCRRYQQPRQLSNPSVRKRYLSGDNTSLVCIGSSTCWGAGGRGWSPMSTARSARSSAVPGGRARAARARGRLTGAAATCSTLVAVVSGRTATDARTMVGVDGLTYVGNHGLEVLAPKAGQKSCRRRCPGCRDWRRCSTDVAGADSAAGRPHREQRRHRPACTTVWRQIPTRARHELLGDPGRRARSPVGLRIEEGRMVINLLPPLTASRRARPSAGSSREHQLERLVYLGDDVTDAHAFSALQVLRQSGEVRTLEHRRRRPRDAAQRAAARRRQRAVGRRRRRPALWQVAERLKSEC